MMNLSYFYFCNGDSRSWLVSLFEVDVDCLSRFVSSLTKTGAPCHALRPPPLTAGVRMPPPPTMQLCCDLALALQQQRQRLQNKASSLLLLYEKHDDDRWQDVGDAAGPVEP